MAIAFSSEKAWSKMQTFILIGWWNTTSRSLFHLEEKQQTWHYQHFCHTNTQSSRYESSFYHFLHQCGFVFQKFCPFACALFCIAWISCTNRPLKISWHIARISSNVRKQVITTFWMNYPCHSWLVEMQLVNIESISHDFQKSLCQKNEVIYTSFCNFWELFWL